MKSVSSCSSCRFACLFPLVQVCCAFNDARDSCQNRFRYVLNNGLSYCYFALKSVFCGSYLHRGCSRSFLYTMFFHEQNPANAGFVSKGQETISTAFWLILIIIFNKDVLFFTNLSSFINLLSFLFFA